MTDATQTLFRLGDLKAHAVDRHRPNPAMVTMTTAQALALIRVAEAAQRLIAKGPNWTNRDLHNLGLYEALAPFEDLPREEYLAWKKAQRA